MYPGRMFYIFFLWLVSLEIILDWEKFEHKTDKLKSLKAIFAIVTLLFPTLYVVIYVVATNYYGLNFIFTITPSNDTESGRFAYQMLLSEYLVFAALFALTILVVYGRRGLMDFSIPVGFLGIIGLIYMTDYLYPNGRFIPFQILVFPTSTLAENVLKLMGYQTMASVTIDSNYGWMPNLTVWDPKNPFIRSPTLGIAWPCAGIESLIIYTVTILFFLKKTAISVKQKIGYFVIGAIITYFINILRIVTIFLIALKSPQDMWVFHSYYGWLYSTIWIMSYPLIIIGSRLLWGRIRKRSNTSTANYVLLSTKKTF
jgi:exosortase/archaeosortase family protein